MRAAQNLDSARNGTFINEQEIWNLFPRQEGPARGRERERGGQADRRALGKEGWAEQSNIGAAD